MRKLASLVIVLGMLVCAGTAIAEEKENPCGFLSSQTKDETGEIYYINPREISHIQAIHDSTSTSVGSTGRYILGVVMTTGHVILYGRYTSYNGRRNAINYISNKVIQCNKGD